MDLVSNLFIHYLLPALLVGTVYTSKTHKHFNSWEDDLADSPDIEIDDTLAPNTYENEENKNEPASVTDESDFNDDYSDVLTGEKLPYANPNQQSKKSDTCASSDTPDMCVCRRYCLPNVPSSFEPCNCDTNNGINPIESPPLLASQPSVPSFSSSLIQTNSLMNCMMEPSSPYCMCQRACIPGSPVNYDPCTCLAFNNPVEDKVISQPSTIDDVDPSTFASLMSYANSLTPQFDTYSNSFAQPAVRFDDNSCARACLPYTVKETKPCSCNFNLMTGQPNSRFSPSMVPTGYDSAQNNFPDTFQNRQNVFQSYPNYGFPQVQQQTTISPYINSHILKIPRPESSVGAYLGCYHDKKKPGRDLKMSVPVPKLTPDSCVNKCREYKKRFAAVQNGYLCFCGSRFGRYNRTKDALCGVTCTGDPKKYCGGHWLNAVYSTDGQLYNPKQFSFKTQDPKDELEYEKSQRRRLHTSKHRLSSPSKKQRTSGKTKISSDEWTFDKNSAPKHHHVQNKLGRTLSNKNKGFDPNQSISQRVSKVIKDKKMHSRSKSEGISRKTVLETAESASDMAQLLALGKKKSKLTARKSHLNSPSNKRDDTKGLRATKSDNKKLIVHNSKE